MKNIFVFILFFKTIIIYAQDTIVDYNVNNNLLRIDSAEIRKNPDGIHAEYDTTDSSRYLLVFKGTKGACQIFKFYQNGMLMLSGKYQEARKFEDALTLVIDSDLNMFDLKQKRLKPLKCGTWHYYSEIGELIKTEKCRKGKAMTSKIFKI